MAVSPRHEVHLSEEYASLLDRRTGKPQPYVTFVKDGKIFQGNAEAVPMVLSAWIGGMCGDAFSFYLGRRYGDRLKATWLGRRIGGRVVAYHNRPRSVALGPAVRALPQS